MKCEVVRHSMEGPQGVYSTYGLRIVQTGEFYGDITLEKEQADALAAALERYECEPCHVPCVIEDFLAGARFESRARPPLEKAPHAVLQFK